MRSEHTFTVTSPAVPAPGVVEKLVPILAKAVRDFYRQQRGTEQPTDTLETACPSDFTAAANRERN
jgi:hypothetical protein